LRQTVIFFKAIRKGKAAVVTDQIDRFIANGVLKSGQTLEDKAHYSN
jgi:cation diffusion facilitator CzcD-associated flavoprotein CzcO